MAPLPLVHGHAVDVRRRVDGRIDAGHGRVVDFGWDAAAGVIDGLLLVAGGCGDGSRPDVEQIGLPVERFGWREWTNALQVFDGARWSLRASMPIAREGAAFPAANFGPPLAPDGGLGALDEDDVFAARHVSFAGADDEGGGAFNPAAYFKQKYCSWDD